MVACCRVTARGTPSTWARSTTTTARRSPRSGTASATSSGAGCVTPGPEVITLRTGTELAALVEAVVESVECSVDVAVGQARVDRAEGNAAQGLIGEHQEVVHRGGVRQDARGERERAGRGRARGTGAEGCARQG